ncbi:MAG: hypothetical protein QOD86_1867, partial [Miltoncostaeaceae bacterium]|nr:hypothetical protein [Miltoncostaeaceae bacterium]
MPAEVPGERLRERSSPGTLGVSRAGPPLRLRPLTVRQTVPGDMPSERTVPGVSLIATVFNEAATIDAWLAGLDAQTVRPQEVVIVDAGSTDGTLEALQARAARDPAFKVLVVAGLSVPEGRNRAIEAAAGPIVAITDAGTHPEPDWLERLVEPLLEDPQAGVSAGFFAPAGTSAVERVLAAVITPRLPEIDPETFLPSSRSVAVRKEWWERAGGYPDWLRAGEDLVFGMRLREAGARFVFAPDAIVHWSPRPTLGGFFAQYRHYARGDGHAHLWTRRHAIRYAAYVTGAGLAAAGRSRKWPRLALAAGVAAYMRKFFRRVRAERPIDGALGRLGAHLLVPVIVVMGDVAKMIGYPKGLYERARAGSPEALQHAAIRSHRALDAGAPPTRLGPLGRGLRRLIDAFPPLRAAVKSPAAQRAIHVARAGAHLRPSCAVRLAAATVAAPGRSAAYRLRDGSGRVWLRAG